MEKLKYISLFSGIEAASVAWEPLGWEPIAFSEIEPYPCELLKQRFPDVPNLGDITKIDWSSYRGKADIIVGGSPCQSFSIAGNRDGLKGESGLMFEYISIAAILCLGKRAGSAVEREGRSFRTATARNGCHRVRSGVASAGRAIFRSGPKEAACLSCRMSWKCGTCRPDTF